MTEEKKGTEKLQKVISAVVKNIKLGQKIGKDGVSAEDVVHIPALIESVQEIIQLVQEAEEIAAEAKDIDASEVGVLLMAAYSGYKEVIA